MNSTYAKTIVTRGLAFALIWWGLAEGRGGSWAVGAVAVLFALQASLALAPPASERFSLTGAAGFVMFFLYESIRGGIQVAFMALRPRLKLRPALLELPLSLPPGRGRMMLMYTLNLLPGTVCAGIEGDTLRLHVIDRRLPIEAEMRKAESRIARMLGMRP